MSVRQLPSFPLARVLTEKQTAQLTQHFWWNSCVFPRSWKITLMGKYTLNQRKDPSVGSRVSGKTSIERGQVVTTTKSLTRAWSRVSEQTGQIQNLRRRLLQQCPSPCLHPRCRSSPIPCTPSTATKQNTFPEVQNKHAQFFQAGSFVWLFFSPEAPVFGGLSIHCPQKSKCIWIKMFGL